MDIAFLQFQTNRRNALGNIKESFKRQVTGGASITAATLSSSLGRPMHLIFNPRQLKKTKFQLAAFSFNTPGASAAYREAKRLRAWGKTIIAGGPHPSVMPTEALRYFDAVCIGAGDIQFARMIADAERGKLKRIYYGRTGEWVVPKRKGGRGLSLVQLSRGCPHDCAFCVVSNIFSGGVDEKPIELVARELERTSSYLSIVDDNFYVNKQRNRRVLDLLKNAKKRFICQISQDTAMDKNILKLLARSGCMLVVVGIESINPNSLNFLGKNHQLNPGEVVRRIHDAGMGCYLDMVFGSDGETPDIFDKTLNFFEAARPDLVSPHILTPLPGTRLYEYLAKRGRLLFDQTAFPKAWRFFDTKHVTYLPDPMTILELTEHYKAFEKTLFSLHYTIRRVPRNSVGIALLSSLLKNAW